DARQAALLAEPQPHAGGGRIDWYSAAPGVVRALAGLPPPEAEALRAEVATMLAAIERVGRELEAGTTDDGRLAGASLRLASAAPADEYVFRVGDQPVVVCWGYEAGGAGAVLPGAFLPATQAIPPAAAAVAPQLPPGMALAPAAAPAMAFAAAAPMPAAAVAARAAPFAWPLWLGIGLAAILLLLGTSWMLRHLLPFSPAIDIALLPVPPAPPAPPPPPDPRPALEAAIAAAQADEPRLRGILASMRDQAAARIRDCKPPPPPKPIDLPEDRWGKGELAILKGCWVLGKPTPSRLRPNEGGEVMGTQHAGRLCFDDKGNGTNTSSATYPGYGSSRCHGPATAKFDGTGKLRITYPRVECDPSRFFRYAGGMTCRRISDTVAMCDTGLGEAEFRREGN
ncbi:MAG: hypothetical protein JNL07_08945, partial [Rhodospirillales bacterium]|nr:hypothetical protein [Rhodospirillales bacterium]